MNRSLHCDLPWEASTPNTHPGRQRILQISIEGALSFWVEAGGGGSWRVAGGYSKLSLILCSYVIAIV